KNQNQKVSHFFMTSPFSYDFSASALGKLQPWRGGGGAAPPPPPPHTHTHYFCTQHHVVSKHATETQREWSRFGPSVLVFRFQLRAVEVFGFIKNILYTGSGDKVARMFEAKSGTLKRSFRGHDHGVVCIEVVTGKLFTGSYDGTLFVWDTTGVVDETVFGDEHKDSEDEEDLPDDSDEVKLAVNFLEPFIHEG
ncbi:unnamed protein product, partial [Ixodes persulcatus]